MQCKTDCEAVALKECFCPLCASGDIIVCLEGGGAGAVCCRVSPAAVDLVSSVLLEMGSITISIPNQGFLLPNCRMKGKLKIAVKN